MAKKLPTADYVMVYVGGGNYTDGVPARDLKREEWEALSEELRALALSLNLYEQVTAETAAKEGE